MQTNPAVEQSKNIRWSESLWNQSERKRKGLWRKEVYEGRSRLNHKTHSASADNTWLHYRRFNKFSHPVFSWGPQWAISSQSWVDWTKPNFWSTYWPITDGLYKCLDFICVSPFWNESDSKTTVVQNLTQISELFTFCRNYERMCECRAEDLTFDICLAKCTRRAGRLFPVTRAYTMRVSDCRHTYIAVEYHDGVVEVMMFKCRLSAVQLRQCRTTSVQNTAHFTLSALSLTSVGAVQCVVVTSCFCWRRSLARLNQLNMFVGTCKQLLKTFHLFNYPCLTPQTPLHLRTFMALNKYCFCFVNICSVSTDRHNTTY